MINNIIIIINIYTPKLQRFSSCSKQAESGK
nr:MAG TPA: hypothetical protein [Caudoviricetes sp.]